MENTLPELVFTVKGMDCAGCAEAVKKGVDSLKTVDSADLNFTMQTLRVSGSASEDEIISRVEELGYQAEIHQDGPPAQENQLPNFVQFMAGRMETRLALLAAVLIIPGLVFHEILRQEADWMWFTSFAAYLLAGYPVARKAWMGIRVNREISMNALMTAAATGAVLIGAIHEAGMTMVLFAVAEALEGYTAERTRHTIQSLMSVVPQTAAKIEEHDGKVVMQETPTENLKVGDLIQVMPGERIPMDGIIISGSSSVDQSTITGESKPVVRTVDDPVLASTINGTGTLEVRITKLVKDSTISRVLELVSEAQEKKAPAQKFVDRFARFYTPLVTLLALGVAIIPPLFFQQPFFTTDAGFGWLYRGLALLVVACPCALVISTPVSVISAVTNAARNGVLFKGGVHLENMAGIEAVGFDKTGTLTRGLPAVNNVKALGCLGGGEHIPDQITCDELTALACSVERRSEHPLAKAVVQEAKNRGVMDKYAPAQNVQALAGQGVKGMVDGSEVVIGSHAFFDQNFSHLPEDCAEAEAEEKDGYTVIMVQRDGEYLGWITFSDQPRNTAEEAVSMLTEEGIQDVRMITGDNAAAAEIIAENVGITEYHAGLLPADKLKVIEDWRSQGRKVLMVGDGINDTPSLAAADVGMAVGGRSGGLAQVLEAADAALLHPDLRLIPYSIKLSKSMMRTIYWNVFISIGIKLAFMVLVLFGAGTMWMAVLADMGTSLLVTLNGTRLIRSPKPKLSKH